jgi:heme/copper-type cytochrome/quinol oxidase subunit 2
MGVAQKCRLDTFTFPSLNVQGGHLVACPFPYTRPCNHLFPSVQICTKFHYSHSPIAERLTHHTTLEMIWTVIPTIIVLFIAVPSLTLIYSLDQHTDRPGAWERGHWASATPLGPCSFASQFSHGPAAGTGFSFSALPFTCKATRSRFVWLISPCLAGLTVKVIGRQWYWSYEMHDHLQASAE